MNENEFKTRAIYNYEKVIARELDEAVLCLRKAINILNSDLIINGIGYKTDIIDNINTRIYNYITDINNKILPAIKNM